MGVQLCSAWQGVSTPEEIAEGYAERPWHHDSSPVEFGITYSHWKALRDQLCLHECFYQVGTIPVAMLRIHVERLWMNVPQYDHQALVALMDYCDEQGYTHIGWA